MPRFHALTVADIHRTTADCAVVTLDVPAEVREDFRFRQGQYLTLRTELDGEEVRRTYSLCSSPTEGKWSVAIKRIDGGLFSTFANHDLQVGDALEALPPAGDFHVPLDPARARHYVAFAAGSGITPILSTIRAHLEGEPESTFQLFYVNRTVASIILKEELEALKNRFLDRLEVHHFLTREQRNVPLFNGRLDADKLRTIFRTLCPVERVDHCFICGPREMIFLVRDEITAAGLDPESVHYELFYSGEDPPPRRPRAARPDGIPVTLIDGGKEFHLSFGDAHDNLLDAALAAGADLPYACKGGVCSTCKCRVLDGSVEMHINYALEPAEVAAGYVLSCQAVPTSDQLKIDFDV